MDPTTSSTYQWSSSARHLSVPQMRWSCWVMLIWWHWDVSLKKWIVNRHLSHCEFESDCVLFRNSGWNHKSFDDMLLRIRYLRVHIRLQQNATKDFKPSILHTVPGAHEVMKSTPQPLSRHLNMIIFIMNFTGFKRATFIFTKRREQTESNRMKSNETPGFVVEQKL